MAYLTRFEDFYKSSDEEGSDGEEGTFGQQTYGPPPAAKEVSVEEQLGSSEGEEEEGARPEDGDSDWAPEDRDWVPQSLVDLKMRIKVGDKLEKPDGPMRDRLAEQEEREKGEAGGDRAFTNSYEEVCKLTCYVCGLQLESNRLNSHMAKEHSGQEAGERTQFDVLTWHRCGLCGKELVFTRQRVRHHVVTEHAHNLQDYDRTYMVARRRGKDKETGPVVGQTADEVEEIIRTEHGNLGDVDIDDIAAADISNDCNDLVKIDCKICSEQVEFDNFRFLHLKKHGIDLDDYRRSYGEPSVLRMVYHRCHICEQIFLFTRGLLAGHLARHRVAVKDYGKKFLTQVKQGRRKRAAGGGWRAGNVVVRQEEIDKDCMFSNDYEDECATLCKICTRSLNYGNLGSHVYQSHSLKMPQYVAKFGEAQIVKKAYHECAICHETLLFIRYHINLHVKTKHNMSIHAYNKAHMQLHNVEYADSNVTEKGRKIGTQKAPQWCDGTMYKCPYCFNVYYRYFTFRIHLINSHKCNNAEERSATVRENEILTDVYKCKVCQCKVKRDRMDIEAHLKQQHKTTLKIYSANFEAGQDFAEAGQGGTDSLRDTIAGLVAGGLLEDPAHRKIQTPKKFREKLPMVEPTAYLEVKADEVKEEELEVKLEPEELPGRRKRSLPARFQDSVTPAPSSPKQPRVSPKAKAAVRPAAASPLRPSISPLKAVLAARSPNTPLALPPRQAKLNHSLIAVPRPAGDERLLGEVGEPVLQRVKREPGLADQLYRCPMDPCSWVCGRQGMKDGAAALHVMKLHGIDISKLRIRFLKLPAGSVLPAPALRVAPSPP